MKSNRVPEFAVIGHPNEGKSAVVSTLSEDDSVRVSPYPGETLVLSVVGRPPDAVSGMERSELVLSGKIDDKTFESAVPVRVESLVKSAETEYIEKKLNWDTMGTLPGTIAKDSVFSGFGGLTVKTEVNLGDTVRGFSKIGTGTTPHIGGTLRNR